MEMILPEQVVPAEAVEVAEPSGFLTLLLPSQLVHSTPIMWDRVEQALRALELPAPTEPSQTGPGTATPP
jgi:hypothetical protein